MYAVIILGTLFEDFVVPLFDLLYSSMLLKAFVLFDVEVLLFRYKANLQSNLAKIDEVVLWFDQNRFAEPLIIDIMLFILKKNISKVMKTISLS
jgi:hypothetical protein